MKVAVCVGGQLRMEDDILKLTIDLLKDAFPDADFFFEVWKQDAKDRPESLKFLDGTVHLFEEYDIDYHPYEDNRTAVDTYNFKKKLLNPNPTRHLHQTKMILNHDTMNKTYLRDYDVVVRTRYDSIISSTESFDYYVKLCHNGQYVISVMDFSGDRKKRKFFNSNGISDHTYNHNTSRMVNDGGIILYPPKIWDSQAVDRLHNDKKLLAAEYGWYQVLVEATDSEHLIFDGCAKLTRCVNKRDMKLLKELMK
jgi:hypothetical protein